jgi:ABC-type nitrate/sulfonate/bicarbonate transport system substrate-binding protein
MPLHAFDGTTGVKMKQFLFFAIVAGAVLLAACVPVAMPTVAPTAASTRPAILRIELPVDVDIADLPRVIAADSLRDMGYTVEPLDFQDNTLSVQSLVQGDLDIGYIGAGITWPAVQKGAPIVTILDGTLDSGMVIVPPAIQECSDLDGKKIGVPSLTSNRALLLRKYIRETCPEVEFEPIVISNQTNQLIALSTGQIDGATVQNATFRKFQAAENTDLHPLVSFAQVFPGLGGAQMVTRRALLEQYPETVKDYIRADLMARRSLRDPQVLADALIEYVKMEPAEAKETADIFYNQGLWDLNGGITPERTQAHIEFLLESEIITPGLDPKVAVADSFVNEVLGELGRQE